MNCCHSNAYHLPPVLSQVMNISKLKNVKDIFTKQINDAIIVASKQSNEVFKEKHESRIDDTICQLVCSHLRQRPPAAQYNTLQHMLHYVITSESYFDRHCQLHTQPFIHCWTWNLLPDGPRYLERSPDCFSPKFSILILLALSLIHI